MAETERVNVWFDRPGDFLEIGWSGQWAVRSHTPPDAEFGITVHLTEEKRSTGFDIIGPIHFSNRCEGESMVVAEVQPHPLNVEYDRAKDRWDVHWGHAAVDCVATPNQRIRAKVDAEGLIQGVQISDLRGFKDEILNQDLYPVKPGAQTL